MDAKKAVKELQRIYDAVLLGDLGPTERQYIYDSLNRVMDFIEHEF